MAYEARASIQQAGINTPQESLFILFAPPRDYVLKYGSYPIILGVHTRVRHSRFSQEHAEGAGDHHSMV